MTAQRISPKAAREEVQRNEDTLLVCAYDDPQKCEDKLLEGAVPLTAIEEQAQDPAGDRRIIFYCA